MMQERIRIMENVPLSDFVVSIMLLELCQCPICNVFPTVRAIFIVDVERKALASVNGDKNGMWNNIRDIAPEICAPTYVWNTDYPILYFSFRCWKNGWAHVYDIIKDSLKKNIAFSEGAVEASSH